MGVADLILLDAWLFSAIFCFFVAFEMVYPPIKGVPLRDKKRFNVS